MKGWRTTIGWAMLLCAAGAPAAWGHGGRAHGEAIGWADWNWDPIIVGNLLAGALLYLWGLRQLWGRAGVGRAVSRWQAAAFACGVLALVAALVSPIDPLSEQLAWVHMIQHMILMNVAAPLLVVGAPVLVWTWGLAPRGRQALGRLRRSVPARGGWYLLWHPLLVWALYAFTLWVWHAPALYGAALRDALVHDFQHLSFFAASCLFWRVLLDPLSRFRLGGGVGIVYLFTTSLHATALGVFMTIAPAPWYPEYEGWTELWHLTTLEDQQLAGLIMWMPACMAYAVVAIALLAVWVHQRSEETAEFVIEEPAVGK